MTPPNPAEFSEKPDFPDWLSPMLVKELRQGMRSRVFMLCFLAVQAALIFIALIGLLGAAVSDSTEQVSVFFWIIVCVPLLLIMPFGGLNAISREKTANTLDLIFLTRLTARRIVFGKWVAIIAQTLLLIAAILPYAVMRYYLGGVNLTFELQAMAWLFAGSALLAGIMVGISPAVGRVGRIILPIGLLLVLMFSAGSFFSPVISRAAIHGWQFYTEIFVQGLLVLLLMLEVGAGRIGPVAENHSTSKRLIALASLLAAVWYSYTSHQEDWLLMPVIFIGAIALVGALCEPVREVPSVYRPFLRIGPLGRMLGSLFYPGWVSGTFFSLLYLGIAIWRIYSMEIQHGPADYKAALAMHIWDIALLGAFIVPAAILRMVRIKPSLPVVIYMVVQGVFSLMALLGVVTTEYQPGHHHGSPSGLEVLVSAIPTCSLWLTSRMSDWDNSQLKFANIGLLVVTGVALLVLLVRMFPAWRTIRAMEQAAASLPQASAPPDDARSQPAA